MLWPEDLDEAEEEYVKLNPARGGNYDSTGDNDVSNTTVLDDEVVPVQLDIDEREFSIGKERSTRRYLVPVPLQRRLACARS